MNETPIEFAQRLLTKIFVYLSDCLICRVISFIFTLQAGIIWLGFALNFILQLLFLPFDEHRTRTFLASYLMVPGTVAFSSHYFWFIIQTACHVFQREMSINSHSSCLLIFINSNVLIKRIHRLSIIFITLISLIYHFKGDSWQMLIYPAGQVPLILMWLLNGTHLIGMFLYVLVSCFSCLNAYFPSDSIELTVNDNRWEMFSAILSIVFQCLAMFHHILWFPVFILWLFLFTRCCPMDKQMKRLITYKLFLLFILGAMMTSLTFALRSRIDLQRSERFSAIFVLVIAGLFQILLLLPFRINLKIFVWNLIEVQCLLINILMLTSSVFVLIGVNLLLLNPHANKWIVIVGLVPLLSHLFLLFIYFLFSTIADTCHRRSNSSHRLIIWIESHHQISVFRNVFYLIFLLMIFIGFVGLALSSTVFFREEIPLDNRTYFGSMLLEKNEDLVESCHWNFHSLNIQDLVLLAALAYRPTDQVRIELEKFFVDLQFRLDENFSDYKAYGYGDVTYFTVTSEEMVIVSIRGTKLLYEWLIDFDTWTESFIYQIISILFPWSKLFPEQLTSKIVHHMALLKRLSHRTEESKRFYVLQMIQILEKIHRKYFEKKSFIVVGHSLGGGLAKLSGIALNFTNILVSVSGPGITHAHATVDRIKDVSMKTINERIFNIYHDRDLVPWIDKQEGLIQIITCPKHFQRLQCHSITPLFCHLVRICGNPKQFRVNPQICLP